MIPKIEKRYHSTLSHGIPFDQMLNGGYLLITHSVEDLGAATTPDDMIQVHFTTPAIATIGGYVIGTIEAHAAAGALFKITEAPTGGLASPTGTLYTAFTNRVLNLDLTPMTMYYDGTVATGGTEIYNQYLGQATQQAYTEDAASIVWLLKPETTYAISIFKAEAIAASIVMKGWVSPA